MNGSFIFSLNVSLEENRYSFIVLSIQS
jgi:hypothetical protein